MRKKHRRPTGPKPEAAIAKVRQVGLLVAHGYSRSTALGMTGITAREYDRWRQQFDGHPIDAEELLRELERQNQQLRRVVVGLALDIARLRRELGEP